MIKQKLLKVLLWIKDHFHFLVEVVVRLSVGIDKETTNPCNSVQSSTDNLEDIEDPQKGVNHD